MWSLLRHLRYFFLGRRPEASDRGREPAGIRSEIVNYPWYETVEGEAVEQGDFLFGFNVVVPLSDPEVEVEQLDSEIKDLDLVVMSQTCDIEHGKIKSLLLCPWWDLWRFVDAAPERGETNWGSELREDLRRGNMPGYHLVNEASQDGMRIGVGVIDFHEVYTAPTAQVKSFAKRVGKRLRLRPPYREHMAQAFARYFMRVGLPVDIAREKVKKRPSSS